MSPEEGWNEYRLMIIDWHTQDLEEKKEIRSRLEIQEQSVNAKLDVITAQLAEMRGYGKARTVATNLLVPALVTIAVLLAEPAIAKLWQ